jgi:RNA-splicing ligase RtcB
MAKYVMETFVEKLRCVDHVNLERAALSVGTLGGGNHFIEVDEGVNHDTETYLVIHSGSRYLGKQIAEYYQSEAVNSRLPISVGQVIANLKAAGRSKEIEEEIKKLRVGMSRSDTELAYLEGKLYDDYLHDMSIAQQYAAWNRKAIMMSIFGTLKDATPISSFETIHNYIDLSSKDEPILRKGAISAMKGQRVLIPMNMRDGSLICVGLGNSDWNSSAPHGAGRIMSRRVARDTIKMEDYKAAMEGIMSTTVNRSTIDEAPFAYKPMDEIIANIGETVTIEKRIVPIYNFKAAE